MNPINLKLQKLFTEKKFFEIINIIENEIPSNEVSAGLLNILGASRVLSVRENKNILLLALENFKQAYLKEKNTNIGLDALTNYINLSTQILEFKNEIENLDNFNEEFNKIENLFNEARIFFDYDKKFFLAIVRFYKKINNIDNCLFYLDKIFEKKDGDINSICSYIYYKSFKYGWSQNDFLNESKKINTYCNQIISDNLLQLNKKKNQKIKVGFLSSDIQKKHSVTYFLKSILNNKASNRYEFYLFLNNKDEDNTTKEFSKLADVSLKIYNLNDLDAINAIRQCNLDIIFDLMVITSSNRISLFKNRLAPIQISWLGYCNTSGLDEMDYIIADENLIKKNEENLYSEKVIYLNDIWSCHSGFNFVRQENISPCVKKDHVVFGSFNNFNKINENVVRVWSRILKEIDSSRLILKSSVNVDLKKIKEIFNKYGVLERVIYLENKLHFENHLKTYNDIDIALDTFPYNGVTTSFEAIWMGVPVLTMAGFNFNSRCGESINKNIKMDCLIAKNEDEYVFKAINLATNKEKLLEIRKKLFESSLDSPLFNQKKFSNSFFNSLEIILKK